MSTTKQVTVPPWVVAIAFAGAMSALAGGYWDDAWHTERGRDDFFIAPHIAIYAGIATSGAALTLWALLIAKDHGTQAVWGHKPLALALLSVAVTLVSGPIDNAWHVAFGRDAVIWSPPHMLGIAGTLALGAAILAELAGRRESWARPATSVAGALVLASACFATVEYDTDVPQFDVVFYLPVLGFAAAAALVLVRAATDTAWAATAAAATYTVFIAVVGGFLGLVDFPPPALPLIVLPALVLDLGSRRGWPPILVAFGFTVALHLAYVPVRNVLGDGVRFDTEDVVLGGLLTLAATSAVFAVVAGRTMQGVHVAAAAMLCITIAPWITPQPASAHDPGQGEDAGTVGLDVWVRDGRATLVGQVPGASCSRTEAVAVVARRGGEELRGPLRKQGCSVTGTLTLPTRGRWFLYAELRRGRDAVEAWLPVSVEDGRGRASADDRYAYIPPQRSASIFKLLVGIVLYAGMLALLYATLRLIQAGRRDAQTSEVTA